MAFCAALAAGLAITPAHAKLYKWVDENGNVTYSQQPPPAAQGAKVQSMELRGYKSADPEAGEKLDALKERAESAREDREFAKTESQAAAERKERLAENCKIARQNVRLLKSSARIQDKTEDGQTVYLDDAGVAAKLKQAEKQVEDYC